MGDLGGDDDLPPTGRREGGGAGGGPLLLEVERPVLWGLNRDGGAAEGGGGGGAVLDDGAIPVEPATSFAVSCPCFCSTYCLMKSAF